jgi:eight-cysteine-cluster-containing protein
MTRAVLALLACGLFACNAHTEPVPPTDAGEGVVAQVDAAVAQAAEAQAEPVAEVSEASDGPAPQELPADRPTPQMLYDQCHDRLEGAEQDGECSTDADCGTSGCSQEVCVPVAERGNVMTTCEILPCFGAVEACGCHEGRCTWSVKQVMEPQLPKLPLPPKDDAE